MSDINLFELTGKAVRRIYEAVEDGFMASEQLFSNTFPISLSFGNHHYWSSNESNNIAKAACEAFNHRDWEEAEHQFRREIYFCSIFPAEANSPNEICAKAGLKQLEQCTEP